MVRNILAHSAERLDRLPFRVGLINCIKNKVLLALLFSPLSALPTTLCTSFYGWLPLWSYRMITLSLHVFLTQGKEQVDLALPQDQGRTFQKPQEPELNHTLNWISCSCLKQSLAKYMQLALVRSIPWTKGEVSISEIQGLCWGKVDIEQN